MLAEHHKVDLGVMRIWNPVTYEIDAVEANNVRQEWMSLNPEMEGDLQFLQAALPATSIWSIAKARTIPAGS